MNVHERKKNATDFAVIYNDVSNIIGWWGLLHPQESQEGDVLVGNQQVHHRACVLVHVVVRFVRHDVGLVWVYVVGLAMEEVRVLLKGDLKGWAVPVEFLLVAIPTKVTQGMLVLRVEILSVLEIIDAKLAGDVTHELHLLHRRSDRLALFAQALSLFHLPRQTTVLFGN